MAYHHAHLSPRDLVGLTTSVARRQQLAWQPSLMPVPCLQAMRQDSNYENAQVVWDACDPETKVCSSRPQSHSDPTAERLVCALVCPKPTASTFRAALAPGNSAQIRPLASLHAPMPVSGIMPDVAASQLQLQTPAHESSLLPVRPSRMAVASTACDSA